MTSGWPEATLGELANLERSSIRADDIEDGDTYVGLENITNLGEFKGVRQVDAGELKSNKFRFDPSHILYGKLRPYLAKIAAPDFSGVCSTDILPVRPSAAVDHRYLLHYLRTPAMIEHASSQAVGANLPRLSPKSLEKFAIPLPPLEEQRRIAAILDAADALRTKRRQALAKFDTLSQAIFANMFGDPRMTTSWPEVTLGDICQLRYGKSLPKASRSGSGFEVFGSNGEVGRHEEALTSGTTIIVGRKGSFGEVAYSRDSCWPIDTTYYVDHTATTADLRWLYYLMRGLPLTELNRGAAVPGLNRDDAYSQRLFLPPMAEQVAFADLDRQVQAVAEPLRRQAVRLDNLFAALQQRAFRGEL